MAKPNRWVDFIRKFAKDNDTTYSCALSNPKCKEAYRAKYGIKKAVPARTERERMGLEDVNVKPEAKPKAKPKKKKLVIIEEDEPMKQAQDALFKKIEGETDAFISDNTGNPSKYPYWYPKPETNIYRYGIGDIAAKYGVDKYDLESSRDWKNLDYPKAIAAAKKQVAEERKRGGGLEGGGMYYRL